jgi:hypothetical protein
MDPAPERLIREYTNEELEKAGYGSLVEVKNRTTAPVCQYVAANAAEFAQNSEGLKCVPDGPAFEALAAEYGYAIAPSLLHGAHTYGQRAFELRFESTVATINSSQSYWVRGTEGPPVAATNTASTQNKTPAPALALMGLSARKGLPFGFETGAFFGWLGQTSLFVPGVSVRWAPKEGFHDDLPGLLPDLSIGAQFRTITGTSKLSVYTTSIDVAVSKRIVVANALEFTPYLGGQRLIVAARSGALDLTPNVDAVEQCGFVGYDETKNRSKICANYDELPSGVRAPRSRDFINTATFDTKVTHRTRLVAGAQLRREHFIGAAEFAFDAIDPGSENVHTQAGRQMTFGLSAGALF